MQLPRRRRADFEAGREFQYPEHLRNPDEDRMLRQTSRISFLRTAGEIGALLLEARQIKLQQPLFNQKLRRNKQLCALRLDAAGRVRSPVPG